MSEHINTVVIGGGQAGLSANWHLKRNGCEHVILDRGSIGDSWRRRRDSICLVTPNWFCRLPGFPYDGDDPKGFIPCDQIVLYVERFAASFNPPCRNGVEVRRVSASGNGGRFALDTSDGEITTDNLIGPYNMISAALSSMLERGAGTIINLTSRRAFNPSRYWSTVCSSKAALVSMTQCLHQDVKDAGIKVYAFSP